jgi:cytochrome b involved in lipid metabolism
MAAETNKDIKDVEDDNSATSAVKLFTREEVAKHTDAKDSWIIINDNIYNVTSFLKEVPTFNSY